VNQKHKALTYLPQAIPKARILITVKTYPKPSGKYGELVCTAGLLEGEKWVRIYPVNYKFLSDDRKYGKYSWIELDLMRNLKDFRPESYRPEHGIDEDIKVIGKLGTEAQWAARKDYILKEVFTSMKELIKLAKSHQNKSLAVYQPEEIIDFVIEEDDREWRGKWLAQAKQGNFFEANPKNPGEERPLIQKLPYKYSYKFIGQGDTKPRKLSIEDWEIGALFWNCLKRTNGDEKAANILVQDKYFTTFREKKDLHLFLGTTLEHHGRSRNPFIIIGVFYPPKSAQVSMF
jgi:hypothetical protein